MNLYEKLNRLDDSLVESKRVVKKKKLTESAYDPYPAGAYGDRIFKILDKCSAEDIIKFINEYGWNFYMSGESIRDVYDHINSYLESHSGYSLWSELSEYFEENDYDDDIDEMLTESYSNEMTEFMNWIQEYRNGALWDAFAAEFEAEQDPDMDLVLDWLETFDETAYYDYIQDDDETLTENRWNPYFTPYGHKDAAKVLNGKAPEYYYHLKHIEMDTGDGIKLARYALRKGLPVMVDKDSDPDYPEFAIKGEYHWDDYFYPYPSAHEDNLIPWDGKMFVEEQLTEA